MKNSGIANISKYRLQNNSIYTMNEYILLICVIYNANAMRFKYVTKLTLDDDKAHIMFHRKHRVRIK